MTSSFSYPEEAYVLIGEVIKVHGLRGELKVACYSGQPENVARYRRLALIGKDDTIPRGFALEGSRVKEKTAIVRLQGLTDRNQAELLVGHGVLVLREDLPALADNEFYWRDVAGRRVLDAEGRDLGRVSHLFSNGSQDVMVVTGCRNEYMVPVVAGIVVAIREDAVVIDPPPGLLDINFTVDE
jgi:16S rRNA processing protein RimM